MFTDQERQQIWRAFIYSLAIGVVALTFAGCAQMFTAKTRATYTSPDGKQILYESDKEQVGLEAHVNPETGEIHIKVDKASTPEAVIAAVLQVQTRMLDMIQQLQALLAKTPVPVTP
jgi:hypothetical protein